MELRRPLAPALRIALSPCPFCGIAPDEIAELRRFEGMHTRTLHQVVCRCGAAGPAHPSAAAAARVWDTPPRGARAVAAAVTTLAAIDR